MGNFLIDVGIVLISIAVFCLGYLLAEYANRLYNSIVRNRKQARVRQYEYERRHRIIRYNFKRQWDALYPRGQKGE